MKFYVHCKDIKMVIDRPTFYEAAFWAIRNALLKDKESKLQLSALVFVSEHGFFEDVDDIGDGDQIIPTSVLLKDLGIQDAFKIPSDALDGLKALRDDKDLPEGIQRFCDTYLRDED